MFTLSTCACACRWAGDSFRDTGKDCTGKLWGTSVIVHDRHQAY